MRGGEIITSVAQLIARDHDLLTGLADDDHTQYVLRSILTANGDIFIRSGGVIARLAIGATEQLLGITAGLPAWETRAKFKVVRKAADQSITSSTTLTNDNALLFAVGANEVWEFTLCFICYSASSAPDIKFAFSIPSGSLSVRDSLSWTTITSDITDGTSPKVASLTGGTTYYVMAKLLYVGGGSGGNVQFQWAQNTSDATATTVKANSFIVAYKLS